MNVIAEEGRVPIKMWTSGVDVEEEALQQLRNVASLPFIYRHIAVMPDVHWGIGATVGSVIPTQGAIIPAAVGVDIGCGMIAARTTLAASDLPESLKALRTDIEWGVPVGMNSHKPERAPADVWAAELAQDYGALIAKHPKVGRSDRPILQIGTLGGGNHFIEVCLDQEQRVWVMLHSGSRNIGNVIGHYFIEVAREDMRRHFINLPDRDLAYLPEGTEHFDDYVTAVGWAQKYARLNREQMLRAVIRALQKHTRPFETPEFVVNCHHNYVERENHFGVNVLLTRKGAVRAREGDLGIIPGSMGVRSYIVRGKGNPDSFQSCSHGAGRRMSRKRAKESFTVADHEAATAGVECRKDAGVLDETPGAYKDIEAVIAAQADLIDVLYTLKQVVCVKG